MDTIQAVRHAPAVGEGFVGALTALRIRLTDRAIARASSPWLNRTVVLASVTLAGLGLVTQIVIEKVPNGPIVGILIALIYVGLAIENARFIARAQQAATFAERNRLARELHDSVTQSLFGLTLLAESGGRLASVGDLSGVQECLTRLGETAQQTSKDLRRLVYELGPLALQHDGLVEALRARLDSVERRSGVDATLFVDGVGKLSKPVEECLYRIAEQALNNSLKHARETAVHVVLRAEGTTVELAVADDGQGFEATSLPDQSGNGLRTMRERAELLGGTLTLETGAGRGTHVVVRLPV